MACLLFHVILQSPVDGLGFHAGLPIRETGKGGRMALTLYSGSCDSQLVDVYAQHLLQILRKTGWGTKTRQNHTERNIRYQENTDYALQMEVGLGQPQLPINWFMRPHEVMNY